jgi:hypothetical protein
VQVPIPNRATQHLAKLALFTPSLRVGGESPTLAVGEEIFGIYRNNVDVPTRGIMITSAGLHIQFVSHSQYVPYSEIKDMLWYTWDRKELQSFENRRLLMELGSGDRLELHIVGARAGGLDLSHFHNFLLAAVQTRQVEGRRVIRQPI